MEYYKVVLVAYQCRRLHCLESTLHNCALKGMSITISHLMQFLMSQQPRGGGGRGEKSLEFNHLQILDFKPGQILMELGKPQTVSEYSPSGMGAKIVRSLVEIVDLFQSYIIGASLSEPHTSELVLKNL